MFISSAPSSLLNKNQKRSWKTLSDWFKNITDDYRTTRRQKEGATGIAEKYGEKKQLMDDLLLEMAEQEEKAREMRKMH